MSHQQYPGVGYIPAYLGSGVPFASSSISVPNGVTIGIKLPAVSKYLTVKNLNTGSNQILLLGWSRNGVESKGRISQGPLSSSAYHANYVSINPNSSYSADVKVVRVYLRPSGSYSINAEIVGGLTNIVFTELNNNWSGSAGVG